MKISAFTTGENNTRSGAMVFLDKYELEYLTGKEYHQLKTTESYDLDKIKSAVSNIGNVAYLKRNMLRDLEEVKKSVEKAFFPLKGDD